jgi:signal transduction histidine kinase
MTEQTSAPNAVESGIPLFLTQLSERLRGEAAGMPAATSAIGSAASRHGLQLQARGYSVSQVVHHYGAVCQAITALAAEQQAPITSEEFHTLNGCLDTAIAEAVTEHTRVSAKQTATAENERVAQATHEFRNLLNSASLAFQVLKNSEVTISGSVGKVLGRSLMGLRGMIDSTLTQIRLTGQPPWRERIRVSDFIDTVTVVANLHAEYRDVTFVVQPVGRDLVIEADPQLLSSAVMNLLMNAFKYTPVGGRVWLRAHGEAGRLRIEVEDECGGFPDIAHPFRPFGEQRARDRTGLGLGLSIARQAIRAHGGDIHIRNIAGKGCVFVATVPLAESDAPSGVETA